MYVAFFFNFFFQAEDGIRDGHVTGVQTCALPISIVCSRRRRRPCSRCAPEAGDGRASRSDHLLKSRSEERRVGKECRVRWLPKQEINNKKEEAIVYIQEYTK